MKKIIITILTVMFLISCAQREIVKPRKAVFFPPLPEEPRIQFLQSIHSEDDLEVKQSEFDEFLIGKKRSRKTLSRVFDVGSSRGKIYLVDRGYKQVLYLDLERKEIDAIESVDAGTLIDPAGIFVSKDDIKYVADMKRRQIVVFDQDNRFLTAYGTQGQFDKPIDVAVFESRLYVCDFNLHKVFVVDKESGQTIQEIGGVGEAEGKMYKPSHITVDNEGYLYVNDSFNFRIQIFNPEGYFVKTIGGHGDVSGAFARPKGIDVDLEKRLYVVDAAFENVQMFDTVNSKLLLFYGSDRKHGGYMYLPAGIHIDYENIDYFQKFVDKNFEIEYLIYVGNMLGSKDLNIYGFGKWIGPPLPKIERRR